MALKNSEVVIPIFIFTAEQITNKNIFLSIPAVKFMIGALMDLNDILYGYNSKLYIFYDISLKDILVNNPDIEAVYVNTDYTPYAINRENIYKQICDKMNIKFYSYEDYLLHNMNTILNSSNTFYSVFTPYYNKAINHAVVKPKKLKTTNFINNKYKMLNCTSFNKIKDICKCDNIQLYDMIPTREYALNKLLYLKNHKKYDKERNILIYNTTRLSPYIKFGLVSIREVYHKIKKLFGLRHELIKQLYWREFYYILNYNRPDILSKSVSFKLSYDNIKWNINEKLFNLWANGKTGYPIVDAGMTELNITGYMHNRARLITSNFLVKHLFIDWRIGELYFASKLIDYDPMVNNGSWQFTSGSGADAQPYFRIMNPILQGEKFDKNCEYIKKWLIKLNNVPNEHIHDWQNMYKKYINMGVKYYAPCKIYDFHKLKLESKKVYII